VPLPRARPILTFSPSNCLLVGQPVDPSPDTQPLRWVRASKGEITHQIAVTDVVYFHADEKYTVVRTRDAEHLIRTPIQELLEQLDPDPFWQVHRSTNINLAMLAGTQGATMTRVCSFASSV
jgi:DNA-binding LytR/AlgR family response regulator